MSLDLAGREPEELVGMFFADSQGLDPQTISVLLQVLRRPEPQIALEEYDFARHPLLVRALAHAAMPSTAEMAAAAQSIVAEAGVTPEEPDDFIDSSLAAETDLFKAIELELGNRKLAAIPEDDRLNFDVLQSFFMSFLQSRRARRGQRPREPLPLPPQRPRNPAHVSVPDRGRQDAGFHLPELRELSRPNVPGRPAPHGRLQDEGP